MADFLGEAIPLLAGLAFIAWVCRKTDRDNVAGTMVERDR